MIHCNTQIFQNKVKSALRKIRRKNIKAPSDGSFINLSYNYTKKGHWQVEYVHDTRWFKKPYIAAFFFRPYDSLAYTVKYHEIK